MWPRIPARQQSVAVSPKLLTPLAFAPNMASGEGRAALARHVVRVSGAEGAQRTPRGGGGVVVAGSRLLRHPGLRLLRLQLPAPAAGRAADTSRRGAGQSGAAAAAVGLWQWGRGRRLDAQRGRN